MKNYRNAFLIASTFIAWQSAFATPTMYPTRILVPLGNLHNSTNSNIIPDDTDASKLWVMPPQTGTSTVSQLASPTANIAFCSQMSDDARFSTSLNSQIDDLETQSIASKGKVDAMQAQLDAARLQSAQYAQDRRMADLVDIDSQISSNQTRLDGLYVTSNACTRACDNLDTEINDLVKATRDLQKTRQTLVAQHAADMPKYNQLQAQIKAIQDNLADERSSWEDLKTNVARLRNDFDSRFADLGKMQGGFATIKYESNWDANIAALRDANPTFAFEKIPTEEANIYTSMNAITGVPGAYAVLAYQVPGSSSQNSLTFGSYPENFSGTAMLSLIGACPLVHPEKFDLPANSPALNYGVISSYKFPSMFSAHVVVNYNMHKMYEKIINSGTSGGFFSSHSYSSVTERTNYSDAFTVDWSATDPSLMPADDVKKQMEDDMKLDVYARMAKIALTTNPDLNGIIAAAKVPQDGAVVLSSTLIKTCPGNVYCVAGAAVLSVLDAIFGSSSTTQSYSQFQDLMLRDEWSSSQVVMKSWITSYQ